MKEKRTGKDSDSEKTDWHALRNRTEVQINAGIESDPDALATGPEFWKDAHVVLPESKAPITIRLDADLLRWLRREKGYQTRINAILRAYMQAHEDEPLA